MRHDHRRPVTAVRSGARSRLQFIDHKEISNGKTRDVEGHLRGRGDAALWTERADRGRRER